MMPAKAVSSFRISTQRSSDYQLVFNSSSVRSHGSPLAGQQNRLGDNGDKPSSTKNVSRSQPALHHPPNSESLPTINECSSSLAMNGCAITNNNNHVNNNNHILNGKKLLNGCKSSFYQQDIVCDEQGSILSGSVEALIARLIPTRDYAPDGGYVFTLLLNIRSFIAPVDLIHKIFQCIFEQNSTGDNFKKEIRDRFFANVLNLCSEWVMAIPYDFRDTHMQQRLRELLGFCAGDEQNARKSAQLFGSLKATLNKLERYETALENLKPEIEDSPSHSDCQTGLLNICNNSLLVAQQLTHIELERLSMIGADEFVVSLVEERIDQSGKLVKFNHGSGNIGHYVDWFNHVTVLVASEVLRHSRRRFRVRTIEFFIDVAKDCINVGNFNSLMAIVAGLSLPVIARLKKTWAKVEKSKLEILQHQLNPSGNFTSYRATLKAAIWRSEGAKNQAETIIIPFFGLLMKDLLLIYQRCSRALPNGHLNYAMFRQFAEQMRHFIVWKSRQCPFERNSPVLQYLLLASAYSEDALQLLSYECEMPEQNGEKEQYKKLKYYNPFLAHNFSLLFQSVAEMKSPVNSFTKSLTYSACG